MASSESTDSDSTSASCATTLESTRLRIRDATAEDVPALLAVYQSNSDFVAHHERAWRVGLLQPRPCHHAPRRRIGRPALFWGALAN